MGDPHIIKETEDNICEEINLINRDELERVFNNFIMRCEVSLK